MLRNMLPYLQNQHLSAPLSRLTQDQHSALALTDGSLLGGQSQAGTTDALHTNKPSNQTSLLGEPPKDFRLSTNPYLNLASVLPGMAPRGLQAHAMDGILSQDSTGQSGLENYFSYSQQYGDYSQEAIQQWYDQYSGYSSAQADVPGDGSQEQSGDSYQIAVEGENYYQQTSTLAYGDYNAYVQAPPTYYTNAQGSYQAGSTLAVDKTISTEKRPYILSSPEVSSIGYTQQYAPPSGDSYADSYVKRKKVY
ncbi:uncharacterized protein ACMZJ9_011804 [Mantella aurantiaca]